MADIQRINGSVRATVVGVGTAPTLLPASPLKNRAYVQFYNAGTGCASIGGTSIHDGTAGMKLDTDGYSVLFPIGNAPIYASAVGTANITVLEFSES